MELRVNEPGLFIEELVFQIRPEPPWGMPRVW